MTARATQMQQPMRPSYRRGGLTRGNVAHLPLPYTVPLYLDTIEAIRILPVSHTSESHLRMGPHLHALDIRMVSVSGREIRSNTGTLARARTQKFEWVIVGGTLPPGEPLGATNVAP
jgi:hypothetical protein